MKRTTFRQIRDTGQIRSTVEVYSKSHVQPMVGIPVENYYENCEGKRYRVGSRCHFDNYFFNGHRQLIAKVIELY